MHETHGSAERRGGAINVSLVQHRDWPAPPGVFGRHDARPGLLLPPRTAAGLACLRSQLRHHELAATLTALTKIGDER